MMKIFILHPGKANYPEISAYREYFKNKFEVDDGNLEKYLQSTDQRNTILWCIMGYFPRNIAAKYVIHDYRSLSVGWLPKVKDKIKWLKNSKPNLRIFQNSLMKDIMGFNDAIPSLLLPMGVPDWIFNLQADEKLPKNTYCYIGEITRERGMGAVIEAFIENISNEKSLILIGHPEKYIYNKYRHQKNVFFTGKLPQVEALKLVINSDYAVCRVPNQYPYCYQAPTKLLEYTALNKTVLCNRSLSNINTASEIRADVVFVGDNIFNDEIPVINATISSSHSKTFLSWGNVIKQSGIDRFLNEIN